MATNWTAELARVVGPSLPLAVRAATVENENLYVGDQATWHFNTTSAWRLRDSTSLIAGWTWPNAPNLVRDLLGHDLVTIAVQSDRVPVDPVLTFDNGWTLEVFADHWLDPWTLHVPAGVLAGDGQV